MLYVLVDDENKSHKKRTSFLNSLAIVQYYRIEFYWSTLPPPRLRPMQYSRDIETERKREGDEQGMIAAVYRARSSPPYQEVADN